MDAANPLAPFEDWLLKAMAAIDPAARRALLRDIGRELRRRNQRRIAAQTDPDGSPWAPRKRDARGRVRKVTRMLQGFRDARRLRLRTDANAMELGFDGRDARLGTIHHMGEVDAVTRGGPRVKYAARQLIGLPQADRDFVIDRITDALKAIT